MSLNEPEPLEHVSGPAGSEGTVRCAFRNCDGEVDVPPGTHDGATVTCYTCRGEHQVVVFNGGEWRIVANLSLEDWLAKTPPCPVCGRRMCDHTEEQRGGPLDKELPFLPTLGHMLDLQSACCNTCTEAFDRWSHAIPWVNRDLPGSPVELICSICYYRIRASSKPKDRHGHPLSGEPDSCGQYFCEVCDARVSVKP